MRAPALVILLSVLATGPAGAQATDPSASPDAATPEAPRKPSEIRAEQLDVLFGRLHVSKGERTEGLEQKIWALWSASDSATAEVLLLQAGRAMKDGAPAEALSILNRLVGAHPDFAEAWNKRATLYFMMKRDAESLADIEKVLDLEPRHFGALAGRGMIFQRQRNYGAALEAYRLALILNPGMEAVKDAIRELERLEQGI